MTAGREQSHGWCTLRLRFEQRELLLLKGAEQLRGAALARTARPQVLRTALKLAKAGHKVGVAAPGSSVILEQSELGLLLEALRFAIDEVHWATRAQDGQDTRRRALVLSAFPELADRGAWRSFGLTRELEALTTRLQTALNS